MRIERDKYLLPILVNKQFEITGIDFSYERIGEDGIIQVGKKRDYWYNIYKFENEEQYIEWRDWVTEQLSKKFLPGEVEKEANFVDLVYGMTYKYK